MQGPAAAAAAAAALPPGIPGGLVGQVYKRQVLQEVVLYKTFSICPLCALIDRTGLNWQPASVVERDSQVFLKVHCKEHHEPETHYCSNASWFKDILTFSHVNQDNEPETAIGDIEDLKRDMKLNVRTKNYPLVLELPIFEGSSFLSDEAITHHIERLRSLYPQDRKFTLKVLGKLTMDMETLNQKALLVEGLLPETPILMEVSYERLALLCALPNSIFLRPWIYPSLKYYLRKGDEHICLEELRQLFLCVKEFAGIQLIITLAINRPFPRLNLLLDELRRQSTLVRCVVLSLERPPKEILSSLQTKAKKLKEQQEHKALMKRIYGDMGSEVVAGWQQMNNNNSNRRTSGETTQGKGKEKEKQEEKGKHAEDSKDKRTKNENEDPASPTSLYTTQLVRTVVASGPKGKFEISRQIDMVGTKLRWSFRTEEKDIAFGIFFENLDDFATKELIASRRYASHLRQISGEITAKKPGIYTLRWDNAYSRLRKKVLHYSAYLVLPEEDDAERIKNRIKEEEHNSNGEGDRDSLFLNHSINTLDPYELLKLIEVDTNRTISVEDFCPVSAAKVLEPFLAATGLGKFTIQPSPFCGFVCCLLNSDSLESVPLSRFISPSRFYTEMLVELPSLEKQNMEAITLAGLIKLKRIRKILQRSALPSVQIPNILPYLLDRSKAEETHRFLMATQFLVVHNNMDIAAVDMRRRCRCTVQQVYPGSESGLAASCTGCI